MAIKPKPPPKKPDAAPQFPPTAPMPLDPYVPGDVLPVPEVIEKNSDSVWELWSDAVKGPQNKDTRSQATQPMDLQDLPKEPGA